MIYALEISEETAAILNAVANDLKLPDELTETEKFEFVIATMADSIDTRAEVIYHDDSKPLQMQDAIDAIVNPNISKVFKEPDTGALEHKSLTWEQIRAIMPLPQDADAPDDTTKDAIVIVFNELPQDEWASPHAERLIEQTIALLKKRTEVGWKK